MKYILYARKSTEDEDGQILSIEAQVFELKEFAAKEKLAISYLVDLRGVEPRLRPCHGRVIPFHHRPLF